MDTDLKCLNKYSNGEIVRLLSKDSYIQKENNKDIGCNFIMMNKDREIAIIHVENDHIKIVEELNKDYVYNMKLVLNDINSWLNSRIKFKHRSNLIKLHRQMGVDTLERLIAVSKGVSINDTIWFKGINENITWRDVNPYKNEVNQSVSKVALNGCEVRENLNTCSVDHSIGGSFEKTCRKIDDRLFILKHNGEKFNSVTGNTAESEVIYTKVCEQLKLDKDDFTEYRLLTGLDGVNNTEYSICQVFTNESIGYIEFGETVYKDLDLDEIIQLFDKSKHSKRFRNILIVDAITFNVDRHRGNFGFIIDNDTFKILDIAPNFDYNMGAFPNISMKQDKSTLNNILLNMHSNGLNMGFLEIAQLAMYDEMLERLYNLYGRFRPSNSLNELGRINDFDAYRLSKIEQIINSQIRRIIKYCEKT